MYSVPTFVLQERYLGIKHSADLQLQLQQAQQDKRVVRPLSCSALYSVVKTAVMWWQASWRQLAQDR